jgi:tetratricopeptide (TPR) repeat protein
MIIFCQTCQTALELPASPAEVALPACPRCGSALAGVRATEFEEVAVELAVASLTAPAAAPALSQASARHDLSSAPTKYADRLEPAPARSASSADARTVPGSDDVRAVLVEPASSSEVLSASSDPYATAQPLPDVPAPNVTPRGSSRPSRSATLNGEAAAPGHVDIPGYEVLGILGRGGMGLVYKARDVGLKRVVALKMILAGSHASPVAIARFRTEAEAVARLQHPNIIQIYEIGQHQGMPYFSLEYCAGGSLARRIDGVPFPPRRAAELIEKLARAMQVAHALQIVHRDLKPGNILLTDAGEPRITDFGLAKKLDDATQTRTGAVMGTPSYMAPEQACGDGQRVGPRSDQYALGAILYELLTGRPPFRAASSLETIRLVLDRDPVPLTSLQPQTPRDLETICLHCLEKDPTRRYADCAALADDLRRWLNDVPIVARPATPVEHAFKWVRRNPSRAGLWGALTLLVLLVFFGALVYQRQTIDRLQAQDLVSRRMLEAEEHALAERWAKAAELWSSVKTALDAQPGLTTDEYQSRVAQGLEAATRKLAEEEERLQARGETRQRFWRHFNDAQVRDVPLIGMEQVEDRAKVLAAIQSALRLYDLTLEDSGATLPPKLQRSAAFLSAEDHAALVTACYELLLLWADLEAPPPDAQPAAAEVRLRAGRALALLERANQLGTAYQLQSQAYRARHALYVAQRDGKPLPPVSRDGQPSLSVDWFLLGKDSYRARRYEDAYRAFKEVLKRQSEHYWALYYQALCAQKLEQYTGAKAILTVCRKNRPDLPEPLLLRGFAASELGQQHLGRSRIEAERARAAELRGEAGVAKGSREIARDEQKSAHEEFKDARADFEEALRSAPAAMRYSILVNRGILATRQEDWAGAVLDLSRAMEVKPDDYQAYLYLAQAHRGAGAYQAALAALNQAIARAPQPGPLFEIRADLHLALQDRPAARADFARALGAPEIDARRAAVLHVKLGRMLFKEREHEEALDHCEQALVHQPGYDLAHHLRAELLLTLEQHREAGEALDRYLALSDNPTAEAYQIRGLIHTEVQQYAAAIGMFTMALKLHPQNHLSHAYRGKTYLLMGAAQAARDDFAAYLSQVTRVPARGKDFEDYVDVLCGQARAQALLGQLTASLGAADAVQKFAPLTERQLYHLACLYAQVLAQAEAKRDDPDQGPFIPLYRRRAVQRLQEVLVKMAPERRQRFWRRVIREDPALASLRQSPAFADLASQFNLVDR